jgi:glyoxylase-like metal-dependent hydrolase (beta-lactamase superfamily II)
VRDLAELLPGVWVATSRRELTTSTVVVDPSGAGVVVDPAWEPDELDDLAAVVRDRGWRVGFGLATHAHHDHLLWHPDWRDVPRWGSVRTAALAKEHRPELVAALGPGLRPDLAELVGRVSPFGAGLPVLGVEGVVHDGHAPGHTAYWWPGRRLLVAGDMLSDIELPLPLDPDDLPSYLAGLDALAPYVARAVALVPGHGHPTTSPSERLDADRRYLDAVLAGRPVDDPRLANPGMAAVHERIVALARAG